MAEVPPEAAATPWKAQRRSSWPTALVLLSAYVIFLGSVESLTLGLSLCQVVIGTRVAQGVLLFSALLALFFARKLMQRPSVEWRLRSHGTFSFGASLAVLLPAALFYAFLCFEAWLKPDHSFDGNWYHIPTMHYWLHQGYVHWVRVVPQPTCARQMLGCVNGYPAGAEALGFILVRATGSSAFSNTVNLTFLPLGILGIAHISRLLGASSLSALVAGCLYVTIPVNITQSVTNYVDSSFASCVIAMTALICQVFPVLIRCKIPRYLSLPLGASLGLVAGTKGTGIVLGVIGGVVLGVGIINGILSRRRKAGNRSPRKWAAFCAGTIMAAMLVGGYWPIRDLIIEGSPIYPVGITLFGHQLFPGVSFEEQVQTKAQIPVQMRSWSLIHKIAYTWLQGLSLRTWLRSMSDYASRFGGLGFLWVLGSLPAIAMLTIALVMVRIRKTRHGLLAPIGRIVFPLLLVLVLLLFLASPNKWWPRHVILIYGLGLPCFAVFMRFSLSRGLRFWSMGPWVLLCVAISLTEGLFSAACVGTHKDSWPRLWRTPSKLVSALVSYDPLSYVYPGLRGSAIEAILRDEQATVALFNVTTRRQPIFGILAQPLGVREILLLDESVAKSEPDLRRFAQEHALRYVLVSKGQPIPPALAKFAVRTSNSRYELVVLELPRTL